MIEEERMYIGIITNAKKKYSKHMRKLNDHQKVAHKLKTTEGISQDIIDNIDKLNLI